METRWENTRAALSELENLLLCGICHQLVQNPKGLGSCEHFFCSTCVEESIGHTCPQCGVPSHAKDVCVNRELENAVGLCQKLSFLLLRDTLNLPDTPTSSQQSNPTSQRTPGRHRNTNEAPEIEVQVQVNAEIVSADGTPRNRKRSSVRVSTRTSKADDEAGASTSVFCSKKPRKDSKSKVKDSSSKTRQTTPAVEAAGLTSAAEEEVSASGGRRKTRGARGGGSINSASGAQAQYTADENTVKQTNVRGTRRQKVAEGVAVQGNVKKTGGPLCTQSMLSESEDPFPPAIRSMSSRSTTRKAKMNCNQEENEGDEENAPEAEPVIHRRAASSRKLKTQKAAVKTTPASGKQTVEKSLQPEGATAAAPLKTPVRAGRQRRSIDGFGSPNLSLSATPAHLKRNAKGETSLHVAVIKGDYDKVSGLIDQGAEVNTKDNAGWTPLHEACNHGYIALVELLLDAGAFINVPGGDNETPLHDAVLNNRVEIVELLIHRGADKLAKNLSGETAQALAKTDAMRQVLDQTSVDSQLDESIITVPTPLAQGPVVLLATGLSREERAQVQKCATLLHGRMVTDFCNEVTHLVTSVNNDGQCPRTLKFLQSVLLGKWIITKEWVETCLEVGSRVLEEGFEVPGCSTDPDSHSPQSARLNMLQQCPGLFDGCHFFLQGCFSYPTPSKSDLTDLIVQGGGKMVTRIPKPDTMDEYEVTVPYHAKRTSSLAHCSHYIVTDRREAQAEILHPRLCRTTANWIMDCIARFEVFKPDQD